MKAHQKGHLSAEQKVEYPKQIIQDQSKVDNKYIVSFDKCFNTKMVTANPIYRLQFSNSQKAKIIQIQLFCRQIVAEAFFQPGMEI